MVPGLSAKSSSGSDSSTSRTPSRQESHCSSSSSRLSSSPTVSEIQMREREDATASDTSPVPVSNLVDDGSGQPDETQANTNPKTNKKETPMERGNAMIAQQRGMQLYQTRSLAADFIEKAICMKTKDQLNQRESVILRPRVVPRS